MIFFLPIEPLDARYTKQMLGWVSADLEGLVGADGYKVILPEYSGGIKHGQFLDSFASARFKAEQLQIVSSLFERGGVHSGGFSENVATKRCRDATVIAFVAKACKSMRGLEF